MGFNWGFKGLNIHIFIKKNPVFWRKLINFNDTASVDLTDYSLFVYS